MAVKDVSFFKGGQDYTNAEARRRDALAELLARQAQPEETQMVSGIAVPQSPLAGLAKALTMGLSGYQAGAAGREEEAAKKRAQQTMADAVGAYGRSQAGGTTDIGGGESVNWNKATPDQSGQLYSNILMNNEDTAGLGMQAQLQQMQGQQAGARELDMFKQKKPFELQLAREKAAASRDPTGGDTGALLNRLVEVGKQSDPSYNLISALQDLKGGAGRTGQNAADIATGAAANFEKQSGQNRSDLQYKPAIAGGEQQARQEQNLIYEPQIEAEKTVSAANATQNNADKRAVPLLQQMLEHNADTFDIPYPMAVQGPARLMGNEKQTGAMDLLQQDRLNVAAPLAKALGVNPTDKDFQATLDRIFNVDSTKQSRANQIQNLLNQSQTRLGGANGALPTHAAPAQTNLNPQEQQRLQELRAKHKR